MGLAINNDDDNWAEELAAERMRNWTFGQRKLALQQYNDACYHWRCGGLDPVEWAYEREVDRVRREYRGKP